MAEPDPLAPVVLAGSPAEVGERYGRVCADRLAPMVDDFWSGPAMANVGPDEVRRRTERYAGMARALAPWWEEETAAIARGAGVEHERYLGFVAQKYVIRAPDAAHECTSWLAVGSATQGGASLLHKNRDSAVRPQGLWVWSTPGRRRYLGGGDVGDHGVIHFVNERGLAGAMNAGSANPDSVEEGLPTPQILKLVAETAATCQEALDVLREVHGRGWYTNGRRGSIWLFVDRERGLIVENTHCDLDAQWVEDGAAARANDFSLPRTAKWAGPPEPRYETAVRGLHAGEDGRELTPQQLQVTSRDVATQPRPICADSTLSGFTAEICPDGTPLAWVALGRPDRAPYLPYSPAMPGVPGCVVDGTLWIRSTSRPNGVDANQALEARVRGALAASRGAPEANGAAPGPRATSIQAVTRLAIAELLGFTA